MRFNFRRPSRSALGAVLGTSTALMLAACTAEVGAPPSTQPYDDEQVTVSALSLGATGPAVVQLQRYLTDFGYFPSDELAERFPAWISVSATSPEAGVYDETTEAAVRELQARNGMQVTGIVGPETQHLIDAPRCGNPDSFQLDEHSKFSLKDQKWKAGKRVLTWKAVDPSACEKWNGSAWVKCYTTSNPAPATRDDLRLIASYAFTLWYLETDMEFLEATGTTDITVQFNEIHQRTAQVDGALAVSKGAAGPPNALATTGVTYVKATNEIVRAEINFNQAQPLSPALFIDATHFDMFAIALHEVGHVLGIDHSSIGGMVPAMKPSIGAGPNEVRFLTPDDAQAVSARYDKWNTRPSGANDIAVGGDGSVWSIGTAARGDGFRIYKWSTLLGIWEEASGGGGATRISVSPNGSPWVVTNTGSVWAHDANHTQGSWTKIPNLCAKDLSFSSDGSLWFVTCTPDNGPGPVGGYKVGKLVIVAVSSTQVAFAIEEGAGIAHATRIAVAPNGIPYIVNSDHEVWWRTSANPAASGWGWKHGVYATDISINYDSFVFVTGGGIDSGGLYILNEQQELSHIDGNGNTVIDVPYRQGWVRMVNLPSGSASAIAAGRRTVWATNTSRTIYEQTARVLF